MGRIGLPPILKLDEVLDLITSPDKYKRYMLEFKEQYEEAKAALGDLKTKEQADAYLAHAIDKAALAEHEREDAKQLLAKARIEAKELLESAKRESDNAHEQHEKQHAALILQAEALRKAETAFVEDKASATKHFIEEHEKLEREKQRLAKDQEFVAAQKAKFEAVLRG